jgi:hypothetical protein
VSAAAELEEQGRVAWLRLQRTYGRADQETGIEAAGEVWINFYPVAVHVFTDPARAKDDADRFADAGFARPTTAHYKLVESGPTEP